MHVDRNAAAVIPNRDRAIDMHCHFDATAKAGQMFVDRIIQHFKNAVVKAAFVRVANIHSGAFPDCL